MPTRLVVSPEPVGEVQKQVLSKQIGILSDTINKLYLSGLNQRAILVLLVDATGISKRSIQKVLDGIGSLREQYTHD